MFIVEDPLDQGDSIDIDSVEQIISIANKNPQDQTLRGQRRHKSSLVVIPLLPRNHDPKEELWLLQKEKKQAQFEIKIWKLRKEKE